MTPEQGYHLARYQRPGVKIVMGAHAAREEGVAPLDDRTLNRPPGPSTWALYDLRQRLGFMPSLWALGIAFALNLRAGREPTDVEWLWLCDRATSLADVLKWLKQEMTQ